ncbi:MAG: hypothetical protein IPJ61_18860 [Tessaracoccus sp.]|uniref:hypothetical protein n=1 Tax=Tessaracoccus sp. TaxID=1971211 RepID=UPI001EB3E87B|nr:hypothetical protein [Tessaracoccus sp.]MBK7823047.1 hypothetical protein [Tessaracoccus sp.]
MTVKSGPLDDDARAIVIRERCSTCTVGPGWNCVDRHGRNRYPHKARVHAAAARIRTVDD